MPAQTLGIMAVHAHPDDECIMTGGVLAKASAAGHRTSVVTCTGGEMGEIVGDGMDPDEIRPRLHEVRAAELAKALEILGVTDARSLGYRDSGMMGEPSNDDPACFWQADLHEAVGRLVAHIREFRPAVLATYDAFGGYGHPDHIQAHRVAVLAAEAAGEAMLYPEAGPAWRVPKVYQAVMAKQAVFDVSRKLTGLGLESPFPVVDHPADMPVGADASVITAQVDVRAHLDAKTDGLLAHTSQIAPDSFFVTFPADLRGDMFGVEAYVRQRSDVQVPFHESDLFTGL